MCTAHVQVANISVCLCIDNQSCAKSMVHATTRFHSKYSKFSAERKP